ncbi:MAG TPA: MotA/TolQ/ExbB proton channel family protein [Candidatus Paceibacterota bacterium]|nr:MotA/TolQ/ExbB proton channel family protein [Verrucomicrobiota bacterium]HRY47715.1 MotA/TolQ/ExbB proton channel family protein [Candidatus Paceibacterota bacterium]
MDNICFTPILANALQFAFEKATTEGKITIIMLVIVSLFSWTVMITKARQLIRARTMGRKFFHAYRATRDPFELYQKKQEFPGAPAYEVFCAGGDELDYHLKNNPIQVAGKTRISSTSFESVKVALERAVSAQSLSLEKGMIILSTAVAGGPFIGLLGTVWGVMETFSGIAKVQAASLIAMAPGVAGALIATVVGLFVAIPAMFAYNYMITTIRAITQELDNFTAEYYASLEHNYVDNRPIADEIADALRKMRAEESDESVYAALGNFTRTPVPANA